MRGRKRSGLCSSSTRTSLQLFQWLSAKKCCGWSQYTQLWCLCSFSTWLRCYSGPVDPELRAEQCLAPAHRQVLYLYTPWTRRPALASQHDSTTDVTGWVLFIFFLVLSFLSFVFFQPYLTGLGFIFKLNKMGEDIFFCCCCVYFFLYSLTRAHTQMNERSEGKKKSFTGKFLLRFESQLFSIGEGWWTLKKVPGSWF